VAWAIARRVGHGAALPGAEIITGDIKLASVVEVFAALVVLPGFALLFGKIIPDVLERRAAPGRCSFELVACGVALAVPLWRRGVPLRFVLPIGLLLSAGIAALVWGFRAQFGVRRLFTRFRRGAVAAIFGGWGAWEVARLSSSGPPLVANSLLDVLLIAGAATLLSLAVGHVLAKSTSRAVPVLSAVSWITVAAAASGILIVPMAPWVLGVGAIGTLAGCRVRALQRPRWLLPAGVLFLFAAAFSIYYRPHSAVDLFEDGHALALADAYSHGARPFHDTYPVHGWGLDGGVDALTFRWFGSTLAVFRLRRALFTAASLVLLGGVCVSALDSIPWGALGLLLSLSICPFMSERTLFATASLLALVVGLRRDSRVASSIAGCLAVISVFFALDWGLIMLVAGVVGVGLKSAASRSPRLLSAFLVGGAAGAIPLVAALMRKGVLSSFVAVSFRDLPGSISDEWGLPMGSISGAIVKSTTVPDFLKALAGAESVTPLFLVLVLATGVTVLVARGTNRFTNGDWAFLPVLLVAAVAMRGAIVRADPGHLALYGVFSGVVAGWLIRRAVTTGWGALVVVTGFFLVLGVHPLRTIDTELAAVVTSPTTRRAQAANSVRIPRSGGAGLPVSQATVIEDLRSYLDRTLPPGGSFIDFANAPALYFLLERPMLIPYVAPAFYETDAKQRQVISDYERATPRVAIALDDEHALAFDTVVNDIRTPLVAAYLRDHYCQTAHIGPYLVSERCR